MKVEVRRTKSEASSFANLPFFGHTEAQAVDSRDAEGATYEGSIRVVRDPSVRPASLTYPHERIPVHLVTPNLKPFPTYSHACLHTEPAPWQPSEDLLVRAQASRQNGEVSRKQQREDDDGQCTIEHGTDERPQHKGEGGYILQEVVLSISFVPSPAFRLSSAEECSTGRA